ncbi:hypothetical protein KAI58_03875 [Candidatus Gracilibacteria bacterium]|nr:hypothetical protein [Candidatus Gracilibacteria bacterium]
MKKFLLGFVFSFFASTALAQNLEFEMLRTKEAPGFFAIRIFPSPSLQPIAIQNIFVKSSNQKEADRFSPLFPIINEFGGKIVKNANIEKFKYDSYRIIFLGKPEKEGDLFFNPKHPETLLDEFETFTEENLGLIFLQNIQVNFGGNVSEVYPKKIAFLGKEPVFFVGKFEKEMKTRMEISALSQEGTISAITPIYLDKFKMHELSGALSSIWERLYLETLPKEQEYSKKWIILFPWFLGVLGIFFIFTAFRNVFKKEKKEEEIIFDEMWNKPSNPIEDNLPFEVKNKK